MDYWNRRGSPNGRFINKKKIEATKRHIAYTKKHVEGLEKILDFGVGVGRIFPAYGRVSEVYGYDISSLYTERVTKAASKFKFLFKHVIGNDPVKLSFDDNEFDAVVAVSVLLHQTPKNIVGVMREMARVADKVVVVSWWGKGKGFAVPGDKKKKFTYCFNYDYVKICKEEGWALEDVVRKDGQIYFVYEEVES